MLYHGWRLWAMIGLGVLTFLWLIKASAMAIYISDKMNIPVTIRWITVWPSETLLHGFRIANPPRFHKVSALQAKRIQITYHPQQILATPAEIEEVVFDKVTLNIELPTLAKADNNWTAIGARMQKSGKGKGVIVHKLILRDLTVETLGKGAQALGIAGVQHFDQIEIDQIDSRQGFPTKELIQQIFEKVGLLNYLEKFINPSERIKNTLNLFDLFGNIPPEEIRGSERDV